MLVHGLPAYEPRALDERAITLTSVPATSTYSSTPSSFQSASITMSPSLTGTVQTTLPSLGFTPNPILSSPIPTPSTSLEPIQSSLQPGPTSNLRADGNIFVPMATDAPPQQITSRNDHAVKKLNIADQNVPIGTNKFYANLFLGSQNFPVWTQPYSLVWAKGNGGTYGISVSHTERSQLAWDNENTPPRYFIAPQGMQHVVLSAKELQQNTVLSTEEITGFSAYANLSPSSGSKPVVTFPLVQGMGFVTAIYDNGTPQLTSSVFFKTLEYIGELDSITYKYRLVLNDNSNWLIYATPVGTLGAPPLSLKSSTLIEGPAGFIGMIQVAKNPAATSGEQAYDSAAGAYAANATISATTSGSSGSYTLSWGKGGVGNSPLIMFALPHHQESLDDESRAALTDINLVTGTKGTARALVADHMTMNEPNLPDSIGFDPWVANAAGTGGTSNANIDASALAAVRSSAATELAQDFDKQTRLNSMYYSGKALAKFAITVYTTQNIAKDTQLAAAGLVKLKDALKVFIDNTQPLPLVYDTVWKGVVSSGTYQNGDTGLDFGNTLYNDHHFHYGYFVYTAAVIGYLDPSWLNQGTNKAWVNTLVRDFANPTEDDPYFPFARSFDWWNGHSWAKGLFDSGDGKDQESTSEDTFATYALKMWGKTTGDANMEARANMQLAIQKRSLANYFLLASDNKVQPERFIPNKVTGILFENKVDHVTYFGANIEYIQGIHMLPINPSSAYTRSKKFVQEEWDQYFSNGRADQVQGGWRGVLYSNLALIDPSSAYNWFARQDFDMQYLDGGMSRTWFIAYSAAMR
ncbi:glycoside hydrolase family 81 protein [Periconia macrospinosa]|uniref:glucan endo-1,3-beta-D-glucosidase n=1 Tax=Periconia macrospinosa TaxID=97972 RepID=A0A2V1DGK6_9PLEO|nr:glycoside hydrolase family 81 protein [Periconia macrospinosa]